MIAMRTVSIILANLMSKDGRLNDESIARINLAVDSESCQESEFILLCGWAYRSDSEIAIADAMKRYLLSNNVMIANKAICQRMSRDTVGDAIFSRIYINEFFENLSFDIINVFTSDYHVRRTEKIFKFVFGGNQPVKVKGAHGFTDKELLEREDHSLEAFKETFFGILPGDLKSIYSTLKNKHPFYNGSVYPKVCENSPVFHHHSIGGNCI